MELSQVVETIISHCKSTYCDECYFYDEDEEECFFSKCDLPCDWESPQKEGDDVLL